MKKFLFIMLIFCVSLFFSCDGLLDNLPLEKDEDTEITETIKNNLSESKGTNELTNKTFEDDNSKIQFNFSDSNVIVGATNSENEVSFAKSKFNYAFNSNSNPKTLELQLAGVFENTSSTDVSEYNEQISSVGLKYDLLNTFLLTALNNENVYEGIKSLGSEYVTKIKKSVTSKAGSYVNSQKNILNDFLKTKYESVIHFNYELNSDELVLSEQFKGDLTSAAAKFVGNYGDATITLNDYSNVIPFKIEIPKDESNVVYIGMPKFEESTDISGKITVDMLSYPGNMLESSNEVINNICKGIANSVKETLINILLSEDDEDIKNELNSNNSSEILDAGLNSAIGSFRFEANYQISGNDIILTFTDDGRPGFLIDEGNIISLKYSPILGATYTVVE